MTALGVLCCFALFVCLTLLASFFLPSHLSFKNMHIDITSTVYVYDVRPVKPFILPDYAIALVAQLRQTKHIFLISEHPQRTLSPSYTVQLVACNMLHVISRLMYDKKSRGFL